MNRHHRHRWRITAIGAVGLSIVSSCGTGGEALPQASPASVPATPTSLPAPARFGAALVTVADAPALWAALDSDGALTGLLAEPVATAMTLELDDTSDTSDATSSEEPSLTTVGLRLGVRAASSAPREVGVDEPSVETTTLDNTIDVPGVGSIRSELTSELRLQHRRISLSSTQTLSATTADESGSLSQSLGGDLDACPTADGIVRGSVQRTIAIVDATNNRRLHLTVDADIVATVDQSRDPLSFDLENVVVHLENTSGDGTRTMDGRGRVDDAPGMEIELGTVDLQIESSTGDVTDAMDSLARAVVEEAQLGARAMLVSVEAATDSGLCVQLRLDRHGISSLDPGGSAPLDATVIDAVTGEVLDLRSDAVAVSGSISPGELAHTPGTYTVSTGTDTAPYSVIVTTDSILGAHTVTVDYGGGTRWKIDTDVSVFHVTGFKCDGGPVGTWRLYLTANFQGAAFTAELVAEIGPDGSGPYQLVGQTSSGPVVVQQRGSGRLTFERAPDGTAAFSLDGESWAAWSNSASAGGSVDSEARVPILPATEADCAGRTDT